MESYYENVTILLYINLHQMEKYQPLITVYARGINDRKIVPVPLVPPIKELTLIKYKRLIAPRAVHQAILF